MIVTKEKNKLLLRNGREMIEICAWGTDALRVRATLNPVFSQQEKGLMPYNDILAAEIGEENGETYIQNGRIRCTVSSGGHLAFFKDRKLILQERCAPNGGIKFVERLYAGAGEDYAITTWMQSDPKEKIFGMGQYQQAEFDLKGSSLPLEQRNSQITIPFYLSDQGYGFLWNHPGTGEVIFGKNFTKWYAACSSELDYWVTVADTPKEILRNYTEVTGRAPAYPEDTLGLWQSKLRYRTQEEVLEVAREYHRRGIPLDVIVIDFYHWPYLGDWFFDEELWPDPKGMVQELKEMGIRCMVSIWPAVQLESVNYAAMNERGLLIRTVKGTEQQLTFGGKNITVFADATNPETGVFQWEKVKENYYDHGIDLFWLDCIEPEYSVPDFSCYSYYAGPAERCANIYPRLYTKAFYDGMRSEGREDIVNLVRSAWVGSQRYASLVWSGDVMSTFEAMQVQLVAGLHIGIAGIPWWCSDTGGFVNGNVNDPDFHELLIRWFQFSTFTAALRMHGTRQPEDPVPLTGRGGGIMTTGAPNELWSYGEEPLAIMQKYLGIRLNMKDYLRSLTQEASANGSPIIRAMFYEFPSDAHCWELDDQYMFGSDYLVAPILHLGERERPVYFPEGIWESIHDGSTIVGPQTCTVPAPLDIIPVYKKK